MSITVEAVYENGVLRPVQPLPFSEHEKVRVRVEPAERSSEQFSDPVRESFGIIGWKGDAATFDRILRESELGDWEKP